MKRILVVLTGLLLFWTASAFAAVAITSHTGHPPGGTVSIVGSGFGTSVPSTAFWTGFEASGIDGRVLGRSGTAGKRLVPDLLYGTKPLIGFWSDQAESLNAADGATYSLFRVNDSSKKFGTRGLTIAPQTAQADSLCSLLQLDLAASNAGCESFYLDFWFKISAADTTIAGSGVGDRALSVFQLASIVGQNSQNTFDIFRVIAANDSLRCRANTTYYGQDLAAAANAKLNKILDGQWHRVGVFLESETTPASSSDGKMKVWLDGAMTDSSAAVNWPSNTNGWYAVRLLPKLRADAGRNWHFDFDNIYAAAGHATTVNAAAANRLCAGKVASTKTRTMAHATNMVVMPFSTWSNTSIISTFHSEFAVGDKVYLWPITAAQLGGISTDVARDSLYCQAPVVTAGADSSGYVLNRYTWRVIDPTDNGGLLLWNAGAYDAPNMKHGSVSIDWGDGSAKTTNAAATTDTIGYHTYKTPGIYRVITAVTTAAGQTGYQYTNVTARDNSVRFAAATTDTLFLAPARTPANVIILYSSQAFRMKTESAAGVWDAFSQPIPAGAWVTLPNDRAALTFPALGDTVWARVP